MKQQLWIVNSSLLFIFILTYMIGMLLQQAPPRFRELKPYVAERVMRKELSPESIKNIYKYDLFGTFAQTEAAPSIKSLVTPIPQPKSVSMPQPAELPKPTFLTPLTIDLKGIAYSSDEEKSISIIADETKKEQIYHVGDMLKDAQIIRIGKNRITLLRANGQHETMYLRKEDNKMAIPVAQKWDTVVKKKKENTFEIDLRQFGKEIPSLGVLAEMLSLLTAYKAGKPVGLKVSRLTQTGIGTFIGLQTNDIITSINGIDVAQKNNRITVHDSLVKSKIGDTISVTVQRGGTPVILTYNLTEMARIKKKEFSPTPVATTAHDTKEDITQKLSNLQERETQRRLFAQQHQGRQNQAVENIRNRLLEDIRSRVRNARIR